MNYGNGVISDQTIMNENTANLGGAIENSGDLELIEVSLNNNEAIAHGGAIYNRTTMKITDSTIQFNTAEQGGGVKNTGTLEIVSSTLDHNEATITGGAVHSDDTLRLANSTVSHNSAQGSGGVCISAGTSTIEFSTIVYNTTANLLEGSNRFQGSTDIKNSIFAHNTLDCSVSTSGSINALGLNLDSDGTCPGFTITADPLVGPLANTGGPTQTHNLLAGSPAIDAVLDCTFVDNSPTNFDQRGINRPQGPQCDIGAVEFKTFLIPPIDTPPPSDYFCVDIRGIMTLDDGRIRIQLETPGLPDGAYAAEVGMYDFICKTYPEYPDRLFCDGPKGEAGTTSTLIIFDPLGTPFCQQSFGIPSRGDGEPEPGGPKPTACPPGKPCP